MRLPLIFALLLVTSTAQAVSYSPELLREHEATPQAVEEAKLKESLGVVISPPIPKSWKLVSVTGGAEPNSHNLWFQDGDGSVYLMQGVMSQNKLTFIHENVYKIPAQ